MDVLIVGAGSMGTWFGSAIDGRVAFADVDADAASRAADAVGVGRGSSRWDGVRCRLSRGADGSRCRRGRRARAASEAGARRCIRRDGAALEAMAEHAPDRERLSLHPLLRPNARPDRSPSSAIGRGRRPTPSARRSPTVETTCSRRRRPNTTRRWRRFRRRHAAVLSFALAAESVPDGFETPVYEQLRALAQQVTAGTPRVYADIQHVRRCRRGRRRRIRDRKGRSRRTRGIVSRGVESLPRRRAAGRRRWVDGRRGWIDGRTHGR